MNRWRDWDTQADRDLQHAVSALDAGHFEWAAFAAQQSAEKAVKALILARGGEPWGHSVVGLVEALPPAVRPEREILDAAARLDKHYVPSRYPNGFPSGYPAKMYTRGEAEGAIADARTIAAFCRRHLPG